MTLRTEGLPSQAAVILSSFTLDESTSKIIARGRISKLSADRLRRVTAQEESVMKIQFNLFGTDGESYHSMLGSTGEITGIVNNMNVIQQKNGQDEYQELVLELRPSSDDEFMEYSDSPASSVKQLVWSNTNQKNPCKSTTKRDRFHEIIDSAVLL